MLYAIVTELTIRAVPKRLVPLSRKLRAQTFGAANMAVNQPP